MARQSAIVLEKALRSVEGLVERQDVSDRELLGRFAAENDQSAFACLVRRYSGLVLGVCRRMLPSEQDAEDACQATFVVLARKAASGRWRESVANWLFTTARRIAANARLASQRRTRREGRAAVPEAVSPADHVTGRELLLALDEELGKLPARYREPLVLCYLEGLTRDEVALRLGTPVGTVKTHLERGRKRLGDALTRRGCGLGSGLLALAVTSPAGASPPRWIQTVLASATGAPSAAVASLVEGITVNSLANKVIPALLALILTGAIGLGITTFELPAATGQKAKPAPARANEAPPPVDPTVSPITGRVRSPQGKPMANAEIFLVGGRKPVERLGTTDDQGRFRVTAPRGVRWVYLFARVPGMGVDFLDLGTLAPAAEAELRLVLDHPIRGRILDTQGKPRAGVTVSIHKLGVYENDSVDSFLAMWKKRDFMSGIPSGTRHLWQEGILPSATTDADGRFTITGAGAERLVGLRFHGAGLAESEAWVVNRPGFDPGPYNKASQDTAARMPVRLGMLWLLHGPEMSIVAETEKPIRGVVRDRDTGKPREGVKVTLSRNGDDLALNQVSATTDARGRYELRGARKSAKGYMVELDFDPAEGYMACQARAADTPGFEPITMDVGVKKGVIVTGRILDRATGQPVQGFAMTGVLVDNPHAKGYPEFDSGASMSSVTYETRSDGTYRIVTLPGPVVLMAGPERRNGPEDPFLHYRYKNPVVDPKYPKYFTDSRGEGSIRYYRHGGGWSPLQGNYAKVLVLEPGSGPLKHDILLEPATALPLKIVDGEGKPVVGTWVTGIGQQDWHRPVRLPGATCDVYQLEPGKPRLLVFHDPQRRRFGVSRLKGDETTVPEVKLTTGGKVRGRLVDENGKPLAGVAVDLYPRERPAREIQEHVHLARPIETGRDGTFEINEVVPGVKYTLELSRGRRRFEVAGKAGESLVEAGATLEMGDVKVKRIAGGSAGEGG